MHILLTALPAWSRRETYHALKAVANATNATDLAVQCSDEPGGVHHAFEHMLAAMDHSKFCLVLPGDSASTRRLSEIFLAGAFWAFFFFFLEPRHILGPDLHSCYALARFTHSRAVSVNAALPV